MKRAGMFWSLLDSVRMTKHYTPSQTGEIPMLASRNDSQNASLNHVQRPMGS